MGKPVIIVGEGYSKEKVKEVMSLIIGQVLAAKQKLPDIKLPAIKQHDRGPYNRSKEIERRRQQIEKRKEK